MASRRRHLRLGGGGTAALLAVALVASSVAAARAAAASAPDPGAAPNRPAAAATGPLTADQAVSRARASRKPVVATALTTATSQTTANPDGTLSLTETAAPTRARQHGAWVDLDATLKTAADGTVAPTATTDPVVLSDGGSGPVAALYSGGRELSLTLPLALPRPTLSGPTATYRNVLPGVDLAVTVRTSGAFSDVFTVRTPAAAHDVRLPGLLAAKATVSRGLSIKADATGGLAVSDSRGNAVFTAPAPLAWDSAPAPAAAAPADPSAPAASSAAGPGRGAHRTRLKVTANQGTITLTPPDDLLAGSPADFPVYLDPTFSPNYGNTGWSSPGKGHPNDNHWDSTVDPTAGITQIGNSTGPEGEALSLFDFPIDLNALHGATIFNASFGIVETHTWACLTAGHDQQVVLYAPGPTLSASNATWNYWINNVGGIYAAESFALGYTNCAAGPIPAYGVQSVVASDVAAGKGTQTFVLRADNGADPYAFKEFQANTANLTITYDTAPNTPSGLTTSPATNCNGGTLGDTAVTLYAPVSSPVNAPLTTSFTLYKTSDTSRQNLLTPANGVPSATYDGASGQDAVLALPEYFFKNLSGGAVTGYSFAAQTSDGTLGSALSAPCSFTWDPTRPGAPGVAVDHSPPTGTSTCAVVGDTADPAPQVGTACSFLISPPATGTISGYIYQVNQSPPVSVSSGGATTRITVAMGRLVNTLTVNALSSGGNYGSSVTVYFDGSLINPPSRDGDITNDGTPDLIVPGAPGTAFPAGLWLAAGHADGTTASAATDAGIKGLAFSTRADPADWTGAQAVTGDFCGYGAQDVLAYFPANGGGDVACTDGSDGPLHPGGPTALTTATAPFRIQTGTFEDPQGDLATQVANAGNTSGVDDSHPDLLASLGNQLVLFTSTTANGYTNDSLGFGYCSQDCFVLSNTPTPDNSYDWNSWVIATTQLTTGTAMYLWKPSTGELDLWTGLGLSPTGSALTTAHQYRMATGWNTGVSSLLLRAADINGDGIPDLWVTNTSAGTTTAYLPPALPAAQWSPTASSTLTTAAHAWDFQDIGSASSGTPLASSADSAGALNLTGSGQYAVWNTGDLYSPDVQLNTLNDGTTQIAGGTGSLSAAGPAVNVAGDFTVSAAVKPNALGGVIASQDGATTAGFLLYPDSADGAWKFCMARSDGSGWNEDCAAGGPVRLDLWTRLTATYQASTGIMTLYVDGVDAGGAVHSAVAGFTGPLQIGDHLLNGSHSAYFSGQIADVHTGNQVAPPAQPQSAGSDFVPVTPTRLLDTRSGQGGAQGPVTAGASVPVTIDGAAGIPASGVTAVALSVTATATTGNGFLTVYPDGTALPATSNVNYNAGATVTNGAIVPVGTDGKVDICNCGAGAGSTQMLADVTGYFTTATGTAGAGTFVPFTPTRILDTRDGTGVPQGQLAGRSTRSVPVEGTAGIPTTAVTAVAMTLTAADQTGDGFLTVDPTSSLPATTALTFAAGAQPSTATSIIPVAPATGTIQIFNGSDGPVDVIGDVVGYFTTATTGQKYHPLNTTRLLDTRISQSQPLAPGATLAYHQSAISALNPTLVVNITTTAQGGPGRLVAYPGNLSAPPFVTTVSYHSGDDVADLDLVQAVGGTIDLANAANGADTQLVLDTDGYFASY